MATPSARFIVIALLMSFFGVASAASDQSGIFGEWVSKGLQEKRTLVLEQSGKGAFTSEHAIGVCFAELTVQREGDFALAAGEAPNCQQKNNPVAFEFYCLLKPGAKLKCKIRSTHKPSGQIKEGLEVFAR